MPSQRKRFKKMAGEVKLPVPVTLLSGFLGAGKTTLLKTILEQKDSQGLKVAVLVNDMAALNIDATLIQNTKLIQNEETMVEMHNGCICCALREDLLIELTKLSVTGDIDAIVIESTGISEPQQVAETFTFQLNGDDEDHGHDHGHEHGHGNGNSHRHDRDGQEHEGKTEIELQRELERMEKLKGIQDVLKKAEKALGRKPDTLNDIAKLDTCVTVVDCKAFSGDLTSAENLVDRFENIDEQDEQSVSTLLIDQIEFANVVLLNKTDLVKKDEINQIKSAIKILNPKADIKTTQYSKVNLDTVINTKKFNMDEAELSAGWLQSLKEELKTEAEEYGIGSFIYRSRTPFHPGRIIEFLQKIFFVELLDYSEDDDENDINDKENDDMNEDEKDQTNDEVNGNEIDRLFGNKTVEERDEQNRKQIAYMKENFGHIFRSKGFLWIAGRDDQYAEWSQAGTIGELTCGGPWMSLFPESALPEKGTETRDAMEADIEPGMIKDRRQEIVIIGSDLNKEAITKALDACLLKKEENEKSVPGEENKDVDLEDFKNNGWKFGWKPKSDEDDCLPQWPNVKDALDAVGNGIGNDGEEDCEEECREENRKTSAVRSR